VDEPRARYTSTAARDASYMQVETGSRTPRVKPAWAELSGYDRIALMTMREIVRDTGDVIPLDVPNRGTLPFLDADDIIEVRGRSAGPHPLDVGGARTLREADQTVKKYERATIAAALSGSRADRVRALSLNPLAGPPDRVPALVDAFDV
jgi:alpha-galactosidase/6-phospho-beta-glucosidase family protein